MPTQKLKLSLELHSRDGDFPVSKIRQYVSSRFSYRLHAVQTDKSFSRSSNSNLGSLSLRLERRNKERRPRFLPSGWRIGQNDVWKSIYDTVRL